MRVQFDEAERALLAAAIVAGIETGAGGNLEVTQLAIKALLETAAPNMPPRMEGGATGPVTTVEVDKADTGADTIAGVDADEAWQMASCKLSIAGATTLTFASGGEDLVLTIPAAGILDLLHDESGHNTGADNTAFTLTSSAAVAIKGVIKLQKV